ncbi:MAG TPA: hypothetical protein PKN65_10540, partial [Tenuifilaceae bacterium]|nr:hypothetical protein [Tenuifilaceae bacterium]
SSTSTSGYIYLNYINSNAYGLGVSPSGQLYHDGFSLVIADGATYGINISGSSLSSSNLKMLVGEFDPSQVSQNSQSFVASSNQGYWDSNPTSPAVNGLSSVYHRDDKETGLTMAGQLAFIRDGDSTNGFSQYLQFRFNSSTDPNAWDSWHEVCDSSNNCQNFINFLDGTASGSLMMYQDPDLLMESGLKISDPNALSDCGSLNTVGGVIGCGAAGTGGGVNGSGTANYITKWSNTSTISNSLVYDNGTNVGVGTTSPQGKLAVAGTGYFTGAVRVGTPITSSDAVDRNYVDSAISALGGDNLGDHIATQNLRLGSYWLSGDGGNEGISVDASGNVGIGTTTPEAKLNIYAGDGNGLKISGFGSGNFYGIDLTNSGLSGSSDYLLYAASNMSIRADGYMAFPYLYASGYLRTPTLYHTAAMTIYTNSGSITLGNASTTHVILNPGSNVGIGTTSPNYKLSVAGAGYFNSPVIVGSPTADDHATTKSYVDGQQIAWSRINTFPEACSAGQVVTGIGSTLTCTTTAGTTYTAGSGLNLSGAIFSLAASGTNNYLTKWTGTNTLGQGVIYDSGTNIGIGTTSPSAQLTVVSANPGNPYAGGSFLSGSASSYTSLAVGRVTPDILIGVAGANNNWLSGTVPGDSIILHYAKTHFGSSVSGAAQITLDTSGNLGIGTTSPNYKLSVAGAGYFNSPVIVGSPTADDHATTKSYVDGQQIAWSRINTFPAACPAGQFVSAIGGTLTCATPAGGSAGDNLGNHTAEQNVSMNKHWLSNDGGNEGVYVNEAGNVGIGTSTPSTILQANGVITATGGNSTNW